MPNRAKERADVSTSANAGHRLSVSGAETRQTAPDRTSYSPLNTRQQINTEASLLIFDPHQDVAWVRRILEREGPQVSHVLLGGDYFDTFFPAKVGSVDETCELLLDVVEEWGDRLTVLLGNHDIHYFESRHWFDQGIAPPRLHSACGGYGYESAKTIARRLPADFWLGCRLFQVVNGWLISHAGLAGCFWYPEMSMPSALDALDACCAIALERLTDRVLPILASGRARGGEQDLGGITWLDFNFEFLDEEVPLPQIVGHTTSACGARRKGRSWCLDGSQSCYGILRADGTLEVRDQPAGYALE